MQQTTRKLSLIIAITFIAVLFMGACKKENAQNNQLIGLWECDSSVVGDHHSMWFKSKKYNFKASGEFERNYPFNLYDFGTWQFDESASLLYITVDTLYEYSGEVEVIGVESLNDQNLILIEDYDSVFYNGNWEFIREYYSKKQ